MVSSDGGGFLAGLLGGFFGNLDRTLLAPSSHIFGHLENNLISRVVDWSELLDLRFNQLDFHDLLGANIFLSLLVVI